MMRQPAVAGGALAHRGASKPVPLRSREGHPRCDDMQYPRRVLSGSAVLLPIGAIALALADAIFSGSRGGNRTQVCTVPWQVGAAPVGGR